jgi:hypothetical protein
VQHRPFPHPHFIIHIVEFIDKNKVEMASPLCPSACDKEGLSMNYSSTDRFRVYLGASVHGVSNGRTNFKLFTGRSL